MMLTGTPISGEEAYTAGLANKAVADDNLDEETHKLASLIAAKSKGSINAIMKLVPYAKTEQFAKGVHERSEEHTSELQSRGHLVCRLLLEKKKRNKNTEREN